MADNAELDPMLAEAFKEKFQTDRDFEKDIPSYLADFLISRGDQIRELTLMKDSKAIIEVLRDLTDKLPHDKKFKELFFCLFFPGDGKPRITCVEGDWDMISAEKVRQSKWGFGDDRPGWQDVRGLLIIHTHPSDSAIGFSGKKEEKDVGVLSGTENSFSMMLKQLPKLEYAAIGLCTAEKRGRVLLVENDEYGDKYFSPDKLISAGEEYR